MQSWEGYILLALMMVSTCLSYEFEVFPNSLICNQNFINETGRIIMNIDFKDFPKNIDKSFIQEIGEFLICYNSAKPEFNQSRLFEGVFPLEQLEEQQNFSNQYTNLLQQIQELNSQDIILSYKIEYIFEKEPFNEQNKKPIFLVSLTFNLSKEERFLDLQNLQANISLKDSDSSKYRIIQHVVVCAIIVILQLFQIKVLSKKQFLQMLLEQLFLEEFKRKQLTLPFLLQLIVDNTFFVSLIKEMGAIGSDGDNFLIYFIPGALQAYILWLDLKWFYWALFQNQWLNIILDNSCVSYLFTLFLAASYIASIIFFSAHYEKNIYYQYCIPYIYLPQILYGFKFRVLSLDKRIIFANLSSKIFYILYLRGYPFKTRDVDSDLQLAIIDGSSFVLQLLIFYLQNHYGPKKLIPQCNCFKRKKRKVLLLEEISNEECSICLSSFDQVEQITITQCNHKFHHQCLLHWLQEQQTCPICRFELEEQVSI